MRACAKCNTTVEVEKVLAYPYYCPNCDENMYEFETFIKEEQGGTSMNMTEKEKVFLEDTRDILVGYDGNHTVEGLKGLVDETRQRLNAFLKNKIKEYEESLEIKAQQKGVDTPHEHNN